jgi:hypothetical protein
VTAPYAHCARWLTVGLFAVAAACGKREIAAEAPLEPPPPAIVEGVSTPDSPPAAAATSARAPVARRTPPSARLKGVRFERNRWMAELVAPVPAAIELQLATRELPLGHRGPVICRRMAELVAPAAVAETTLEALPLGELLRATPEPRGRKSLGRTVRVLADGRVRAAVMRVPPANLVRADITDEREGSAVFRWESALVRREPPDQSLRNGLAAYQAVLVVDHLVQNQSRRSLLVAADGSVVAGEGSDAFTPHPVEGALTAPLARLARHVTYSASLVERLRALDRERLVRALGGGEMLATPKEVDQILERKRGLEKLVEGLVKRRGAEKALALP